MKKAMSKLGLPEGIANLAAGAGIGSMLGGLKDKLGDGGEVKADGLMDKLGLGGGIGDIAKNMAGNALKDKLGGLGGMFGK